MKFSILKIACISLLISSSALADHGRGHDNNEDNHHGGIFNNHSEASQCVRDASATHKTCNRTCDSTFDTAKSECGINKDCRRACHEAVDACVQPFEDALHTCIGTCEAPTENAKQACKTQVGCTEHCYSNAAFLGCIRPVLLTEFNCRKDCVDAQRTDPQVQDGLAKCRADFKSCKGACKNVEPATPTATPTAAN
jgi:hypothetical protein